MAKSIWENIGIILALNVTNNNFTREDADNIIKNSNLGKNKISSSSWSALLKHEAIYENEDGTFSVSQEMTDTAEEEKWIIEHKINFVCENDHSKSGECILFDENSKKDLNNIYFSWKSACKSYPRLGGRKPNLPELLSEGMACALNGWGRTDKCNLTGFKSTSGDAIDLKTGDIIQIKGITTKHKNKTSEAGPSSFGPESVFDKLIVVQTVLSEDTMYFYDLPFEDYDNWKVNSTTTFREQAEEGRRPRLNLLNKIDEKKIEPFMVYHFEKHDASQA